MKCTCGTEFNDNYSFCPACGKPKPTKAKSPKLATTQKPTAAPMPSVSPSQNTPIPSPRSFGIVSIILLLIAVFILFDGNFLAAVSFSAAGICLCKPVRDKISVNKVVLYGIVGILLFFGIACIAAAEEEYDINDNNQSYSSETKDSPYKTAGKDYYLGETVDAGNWQIKINSVDVRADEYVIVDCDCEICNVSDNKLKLKSLDFISLNNDGIISEAHSDSDYDDIVSGKSFRTTLTFVFSNHSNTDISLMTMYIKDEKTRIHFSKANSTGEYDMQRETVMKSESSWTAKYNQFYGTNYGNSLYIETTDNEELTVVTNTPGNLNLICWFNLSPDEIGEDGQLIYFAQMSQEGDALDVYSDYELTYIPNDRVLILSSEKEDYYEYFTAK